MERHAADDENRYDGVVPDRDCSECGATLGDGNESRDQPGKCESCAEGSMTKAWETLKALPEQSIREISNYSTVYPMNYGSRQRPTMATANPIIERLIREREEGRVGHEGRSNADEPLSRVADEVHEVTQPYMSGKDPYTKFGRDGTDYMSGDYDERVEESARRNKEAGVELGDRFSGDYVASIGNRRLGENRAFTNSPYGSRAGGHDGPMNVQPGSPMAQMYNMAPQLEKLPDGLQPEWMDEFREDMAPMAKAWTILKLYSEPPCRMCGKEPTSGDNIDNHGMCNECFSKYAGGYA